MRIGRRKKRCMPTRSWIHHLSNAERKKYIERTLDHEVLDDPAVIGTMRVPKKLPIVARINMGVVMCGPNSCIILYPHLGIQHLINFNSNSLPCRSSDCQRYSRASVYVDISRGACDVHKQHLQTRLGCACKHTNEGEYQHSGPHDSTATRPRDFTAVIINTLLFCSPPTLPSQIYSLKLFGSSFPCRSFNSLMSWASLFFFPTPLGKSTCEKQSPWNQNLAHQCTAWRCRSGFRPKSWLLNHPWVRKPLLPRMIKLDQGSGSHFTKGQKCQFQ